MCNSGKFVDRNPDLRAAGIPLFCNDTVLDSLKVYPQSELAEVWVKSHCPREKISELFPGSPILPNDTLHEALTPELKKSRFIKFKEQFFEDLYLRKPELGKAKQVHSIPDGVTNENTLFGKTTKGDGDLYELVLPPKSVAQVNREYIKWHSKYLISHKHYFPGEQIHRGYNQNFDPKSCFGEAANVDITGGQVRRCIAQQEKVVLVKDLQKFYLDRSFDDIGKKTPKFRDPYLTDPKIVFGHPPNPDKCTSRDILHNISPCQEADDIVKAIAYLMHQRKLLQSNPQFDVYELEIKLEALDPDRTGYIPLKKAFKVSRGLHLHFDERRMRDALVFYKLVEDVGSPMERIKIEDFSKSLQFRYLLPEISMKRSIPAYELDTTYRDMCRDRMKPTPPVIPHFRKCEEVEEDSSSPEAFARPRDKSQLKRIFANIICPDSFESIWETVRLRLKPDNDLLSINDIRAEVRTLREIQTESNKK